MLSKYIELKAASEAPNSVLFHKAGVALLSGVDFIFETQEFIYLVEYKNGTIPKAMGHGEIFNPHDSKVIDKIARKFYDSLHYLAMLNKDKPVKYIYVVEFPNAGATDRKFLHQKTRGASAPRVLR